MHPIKGKSYITQSYGLTDFARSAKGAALYKSFPGGIHPGIDFGTGLINHPVVSTVDGRIVRAMMDGGWGNHIEVEGADGWRRQYAHLSAMFVTVGDWVEAGQELGRVGSTGASTAIHLHFGHRKSKGIGRGWEYRDPTGDLQAVTVDEPVRITRKLIKGKASPAVYVYTGRFKYPIPDWPTKVFLFGEGSADIEVVNDDVVTKIPDGPALPSLV